MQSQGARALKIQVMKNLKILSVSSKRENPNYNDLAILRTHARCLHHSLESDVVKLLKNFPTVTSVTLEVGRESYDCVGPNWSHSSGWEILGQATYTLGNPWDSIE